MISHFTTATAAAPAEGVVPFLPVIAGIVVALIPAVAMIYNRKRGAQESRVPTMPEIWTENRLLVKEVDAERTVRRMFESLVDLLGRALASVAARLPLTASEQHALDEYNKHLQDRE